MIPNLRYFTLLLILLVLVVMPTGCVLLETDENSPSALPEIYSCVNFDQQPQSARVVSVTDGDTIVVDIDGKKYNVRYIGINTPELNSDEGILAEHAASINRDLVEDQTVLLFRDTSETDRHDRLLRYVFVNDVFVNYSLVEQGLAWQRGYPPDNACDDLFKQAQQNAKFRQVGIWKSQ